MRYARAVRDLSIKRNPVEVVMMIQAQDLAPGLSRLCLIEPTPSRPPHRIVEESFVLNSEVEGRRHRLRTFSPISWIVNSNLGFSASIYNDRTFMSQALRAVVTGGGGFLGSKIVSMLLAEGYVVRNLSRNEY